MIRAGLRLGGCILLLAGVVSAQNKPPKSPAAERAGHAMRAPAPAKLSSTCSTTPQPYVKGQIFASISNGQVAVFNPDGTCVQILQIPGDSNFTTGSTFDTNGNFYVTDFSDPGMVFEFDNNGNFVGPFGSGYNFDPESIGQAINGNFFVGQADGTAQILEFDSKGNLLMTFSPMLESRGTDWSDLQADQKTIYYTSEGISVLSFDISTNTQNPDFATNLPGSNAYAHRTLPNGEVLVADTSEVVLLNTSGNVIQTYTPMGGAQVLFALNLDPDGQHFWTADGLTGIIYEFDIASGAQVTSFNANNINGLGVSGLAIFGETKPGTADLSITKMGAPNPVDVGSPLTYTLTVGNAGPLDDTNVTVSDTLPAGVTFVSDNPSQGSCSGTTAISCNLGTVKNLAQATVTIVVTPTAPGTVTNTATVTGDQPDPNQTNNTSTIMTTVNQPSGFVLTVTLAGTGSGTVTSNPAGINCPDGCSFNFPNGTVVMLSELPGNNSTFGGWSGACTGNGACSVTMNSNQTVTATFNSNNGNMFNFEPLPGTGTIATVVPGQGANFPLTITSNGFNGVVNLTCSISGPPTITCSILPSSVTLTNGMTTATISVKTFCSGAPPAGPSWRLPGVGWLYLAGAALFCGLAFAGRRRRGLRLAWSSGVLALALLCAGCASIPSGPNGRTAPGTYILTIFATAQGQQVPGGQIQLTLIVK